MSEETKKAPAIRFQGFTDDWEQRKFSNIVNRVSQQSNDSNLPKVEFEDIISGEGRLNKDISSKFDGRKGTVFEPEFILYGKLRPYLKNWLFPNFKGIALGDFWVFEPNNSSSIFDYYLIQSDKYQTVANLSSGTKMPRSDWKTVSETEFSIPVNIEEQVKIGNFFKHLDDTIALHQRKLTLLEQLKQTYLQKLFPQSEKNIPALRFAGFSEHWEQRKLGDTVQITMGQSPNGENYTDNPRDHILVQGNADMKNGRVCPRVWTTQVTKKADPEDIILSVRAPVGDVGRTDYTVVLGRGVAGIKGNAFIFQTLSRMKEQGFWTRYSSGSTFESINSADLKDAFIQICHIEEQTKIGDFFTKLDDTIALHQSKLQKLAELKKTLLAKMLV